MAAAIRIARVIIIYVNILFSIKSHISQGQGLCPLDHRVDTVESVDLSKEKWCSMCLEESPMPLI